MFKAALFTISKDLKQSKYSTAGGWIHKFWYVRTMEYNSGIKRMKYRCMPQRNKTQKITRCNSSF